MKHNIKWVKNVYSELNETSINQKLDIFSSKDLDLLTRIL